MSTGWPLKRLAGGLLLLVLAAACSDDDGPYLEFAGGGFIYNYRLATADYGFVVKVLRPLPEAAILRAEFENPAGGAPLVVEHKARWGRLQYSFRTPPVHGLRAGHDYRVDLQIVDPHEARVLARYRKSFHAEVDQSILPAAPTVIGPGHQPALQSQ